MPEDWRWDKTGGSNIQSQPQDRHTAMLSPKNEARCHSQDSPHTLLLVLYTEPVTLVTPPTQHTQSLQEGIGAMKGRGTGEYIYTHV